MSDDPVMAAAAQAAGISVPQTPSLPGEAPGDKKPYPSPSKYKGTPFAAKINGLLDNLDPSPPGTFLGEPATECMVAECALATGEAMGFSLDSADVKIHPGWLLLLSVVAFAVIVYVHHVQERKKEAPTSLPAERRDRLASIV